MKKILAFTEKNLDILKIMETKIEEIDRLAAKIIQLKNKLSGLSYNDAAYDQTEEDLHDCEDDFQEEYGAQIEGILHQIHDEYCPDDDVLNPIAYFANQYKEVVCQSGEILFKVDRHGGVCVESSLFPNDDDIRLVFFANPFRIVLYKNEQIQRVLWSIED